MRLLVTGGAGFIGANLLRGWAARHPEDLLCNVDKLTYAANPAYLAPLEGSPSYRFERADIVDRGAVRRIVRDFRPEGVIHLAAESHVDNSIAGPEPFVMTNVLGTFNLLEECRLFWSEEGGGLSGKRFHHVSTDEVYGSLGPSDPPFTERSPYRPSSPYSATKAASDHLVRACHRTWGMDTVITNCSNNYGPSQHREKLIPTVIAAALARRPIPVYGTGENVRDWLFVEDHCSAIEAVFRRGAAGETYNIGTRNERRNIDLVRRVCAILDETAGGGPAGGHGSLVAFVGDRPGHDLRYAIDPSKLERELGWRSATGFDEGLRRTVAWYVEESQ
jgi:dTDP-glucose 4,6-dehydratase